MSNVLYPPNIIEKKGGCIFLAGPIQGALPWQEDAIEMIHRINQSIEVACPRRKSGLEKDFGKSDYDKQVDWETFYLRKASQHGVIMFWLAKEHEHICSRAYAQTTRFELAEWKIRHERDGVRIALGIEPGFSGEKYIRRRLSQDCKNILIQSTIEDTCNESVRLFVELQKRNKSLLSRLRAGFKEWCDESADDW